MQKLENCSDDEMVTADWPDGTRHLINATVGQLSAMSRDGSRVEGALYQTEHCVTKHALTVRQRADRTLLVSLYEQKQQILQVKAEFFGDTNGAKNMLPPSHPAIVAAATFMTSIANAYAADKIKKHELKADRDQRLKRI